MKQPQPLDPLSLPLFGERLIEASAGTGKTYTLVILYLRLLLGLGGNAAHSRPLSVEEILVVTFTELATEELRGRIRDNIHELRIACLHHQEQGSVFGSLLEQIQDPQAAAERLLIAEQQMDIAAIYTIHGFCQRMLTHNAFESGILFEQEIIQNELPLWQQATADFWRRYCYPLPLAVAKAISDQWSGPDVLLADLAPYLQGDPPVLRQQQVDDERILIRHKQIINRITALKKAWLNTEKHLIVIMTESSVDKRSYSSRNLPNWLQKVTDWANEQTDDYQLPKELTYFRQSVLLAKTKVGDPPRHSLFVSIDQCYSEPLTLRDLVLADALVDIRQSIKKEKQQAAKMGFDDLLSRLDQALMGTDAEQLAQAIRQHHPVAMIDEFQDTDPQQYRIFHRLYAGHSNTGLLLIGDPKQAIYAFRGADVFTYMQARKQVNSHYSMQTNWRSSPAMVSAINQLFQRVAVPFIFKQIPFLPVAAAKKNQRLTFELNGNSQPALRFWFQHSEGVSVSNYQQTMAHQCAVQIRDWLTAGQQQRGFLINAQGNKQEITATDIAILVRTGKEAALVRDALNVLKIPSVYLSNRDSVFNTPEAKDLLWLLQAVLSPENEQLLRSALASGLFDLTAKELDDFNQNESLWDNLVIEFTVYRQCWCKQGLLPMLQKVIIDRHLAENLLAGESGDRRLTDIMHLGELLQEASLSLENEHALIRWLTKQIEQPTNQLSTHQLRLESDQNLVKIITIHKSKGMEYPLVWLPFICQFRQQKNSLYHDRSTFMPMLDLQGSNDAIQWAEEERLAEDLRLLYVALTRSIYHCAVGIAPLFLGNRTKTKETDLHQSALGFLIQKGVAADSNTLATELNSLACEQITVENIIPLNTNNQPWVDQAEDTAMLEARQFSRKKWDNWQVTSYSALQQHNNNTENNGLPFLADFDILIEPADKPECQFNQHTFPKGPFAGTFLHQLLQPLDFTQPIDLDWLTEQISHFGLTTEWLPGLKHWLETIINTPLNKEGLILNQIKVDKKQAELSFYLPINELLKTSEFDALVKNNDPISARCPALHFYQVKGILKGFIDLVFCWQDRYYLLDFKSNWLGDNESAYNKKALEHAIVEHRYDLQYQLYSFALHRNLAHRITGYNYQQHFGGVFYLFLRGMDKAKPEQGVFFCRPTFELLNGLDQLFGRYSLT